MLKGKQKHLFLLLTIFIFGFFLRVVGINWGGGWYFHPDENNMARAVASFNFPDLHPHFYAYGQFPLFLAYFSQLAVSGSRTVSFSQAIFWLRLWSALFSGAVLIVGYFLARLLFKEKRSLFIYPLLLAFTPGLIQSAHFGTTESILTFVFLALAYLSSRMILDKKLVWKRIFLMSFLLGIGLASKAISFLFFIPLGFVFLLKIFGETQKKQWFFAGIILLALSIVVFFLFSPFYFLNYTEALKTIRYESRVASGKSSVFYTRQFINTKPFIFQLTRIFPWTLGLSMFLFLLAGVFGYGLSRLRSYLACLSRDRRPTNGRMLVTSLFAKIRLFRSKTDNPWLVIHLFWLPWFLFHGFLFAKWTRLMTPILPFLVLFVAWFFHRLQVRFSKQIFLSIIIYFYLFLLLVPGLLFFKLYRQADVRLQATDWMSKSLPHQSLILSETGNVVNLPLFGGGNFKVSHFNFYYLDERTINSKKLNKLLAENNYFLSGSRRVFANHLRLKSEFPKTAQFYQKLFSGGLDFVPLKQFKTFNGWEEVLLGSDLTSEETWTVFDHPTIRIYQKAQSR